MHFIFWILGLIAVVLLLFGVVPWFLTGGGTDADPWVTFQRNLALWLNAIIGAYVPGGVP